MKVRELFADGSRWHKGCYAKSKDGDGCLVTDEQAYSFCLYGAICYCYKSYSERETVIKKLLPIVGNIETWNDNVFCEFKDVQNIVERFNI